MKIFSNSVEPEQITSILFWIYTVYRHVLFHDGILTVNVIYLYNVHAFLSNLNENYGTREYYYIIHEFSLTVKKALKPYQYFILMLSIFSTKTGLRYHEYSLTT